MASKIPRALIAWMQPVHGPVPGVNISSKMPRQLIPPRVQAPAPARAFFSTKPHPDPAAPLPAAAAMQNTEAQSSRPREAEPEFTPNLVASQLGDAHKIKDALDLYRLNDWGFVLFRCTYRSQEKWDKFAALVWGHARDPFEEAGLMHVYARMRWTVFENPAGLDGADIVETSRRFMDWVERGPGGRELAGSVFCNFPPDCVDTPRHTFFLHVDEESLESVVDDARAREKGGYFCTVVRANNVFFNGVEALGNGEYLWDGGRRLEEEDMEDICKRVRIDDLVGVYADLQVSQDLWYCLAQFGDNIFVR
ncbi:hypothetical protein N657DRAFT_651707 [Parathielavia appendiculata]|uniref:Uncharacterized protein n=1 Tax=Parathielavia appendiculata TaxID=2587402 RepID=A0AAN6YZ39_9PEZI|nr:hypothetical protein N657DRAFT_651707 [Parathielavia appendiculata]